MHFLFLSARTAYSQWRLLSDTSEQKYSFRSLPLSCHDAGKSFDSDIVVLHIIVLHIYITEYAKSLRLSTESFGGGIGWGLVAISKVGIDSCNNPLCNIFHQLILLVVSIEISLIQASYASINLITIASGIEISPSQVFYAAADKSFFTHGIGIQNISNFCATRLCTEYIMP